MFSKARLGLVPRVFLVAAFIYGFIWVSSFPRHYDEDELPPKPRPKRPEEPPPPFPVNADQIVWAVKSTATEAYAKLPPLLLLTPQEYFGTTLLLGDLQVDIGHFRVHDVLDRVPATAITTTPDLARYKDQVDFMTWNRDIQLLKEADAEKEKQILARMDKYKWLRMLQRAWDLLPERSWYVFSDADTYLVRPNVLRWLGQFDSLEKYFFSKAPDHDAVEPFGFGGTTFVLSREAMKQFFVDGDDLGPTWEERLSKFDTGYDLLTAALSTELGLKNNESWTGLSGFQPFTIPYGPDFWCQPVASMQPVSVEVATLLWHLQKDRQDNDLHDPLTYAHLWEKLIMPENQGNAWADWDNLSSGPENAKWNILFGSGQQKTASPHASEHARHSGRDESAKAQSGEESWEACSEACNKHEQCMQFSYSSEPMPNYNENLSTKCHLSRSMRLGHYVQPQPRAEGEPMTWKSGWQRERFEKWAVEQRCHGQKA